MKTQPKHTHTGTRSTPRHIENLRKYREHKAYQAQIKSKKKLHNPKSFVAWHSFAAAFAHGPDLFRSPVLKSHQLLWCFSTEDTYDAVAHLGEGTFGQVLHVRSKKSNAPRLSWKGAKGQHDKGRGDPHWGGFGWALSGELLILWLIAHMEQITSFLRIWCLSFCIRSPYLNILPE